MPGTLNSTEIFESVLYASDESRRSTELVARSQISVLIIGETGTGKKIKAEKIHKMSERAGEPFVTVSCNMPETLVESLLFGHEKGSFTGASARHKGKFEQAEGGTIFLDEITKLDLYMQSKLLEVLQERVITPLGATKPLPVNVRVIAATNINPATAIAEGKLLEDLYYRLNGYELEIPPLREQPSQIMPLAEFFVRKYAGMERTGTARIDEKAADLLAQYPWPGNIRELENTMHTATVLSEGNVILPGHLPMKIQKFEGEFSRIPCREFEDVRQGIDAFLNVIGEGKNAGYLIDRVILDSALGLNGNVISGAARMLGVTTQLVRQQMRACEEKLRQVAVDLDSPAGEALSSLGQIFRQALARAKEGDKNREIIRASIFASAWGLCGADKRKITGLLGFERKDITVHCRNFEGAQPGL